MDSKKINSRNIIIVVFCSFLFLLNIAVAVYICKDKTALPKDTSDTKSSETKKAFAENTKNEESKVITAKNIPEASLPLSGKKIVVDAGHGGRDPGALSPNTGVTEADLNLKIAYKLKTALEKLGVEVIMTRTRETTELLGEDNKLQIKERGKIIEEANADIVLSIHQNFNENSSEIRGAQILFRNDNSLDFATELQNALNSELGTNLSYIKNLYYLLEYGNQPSVIVECGFFSNTQDEQLLITDEYQDRLINVLTQTLKSYFNVGE